MSAFHILLLEVNLADAEVVKATLTASELNYKLLWVNTHTEFINALKTDEFDLILANHELPDLEGGSTLEIARHSCPETPLIFVTDRVSESTAIDALEAGAAGFILKHRLERLVPCVQRVLRAKQAQHEQQQAEALLREREEDFRAIFNVNSVGKAQADAITRRFLRVDAALCAITGYSEAELLALTVDDLNHPEDRDRDHQRYKNLLEGKASDYQAEKRYVRKDGRIVWVLVTGTIIRNAAGQPLRTAALIQDITEFKRVELNAEFLAQVSQSLVETTQVKDVIQAVGEQLHRYLTISFCAFVDMNTEANKAVVYDEWHQDDVPGLAGIYSLPELVTDEFHQTAKARQTIVVHDVTTDSRIAAAERFADLNIGSFINVPIFHENEWKFTLGVYHREPHNWRCDEIELMRELAARIWNQIECLRAEAALRESEAKYRMLFNSIDEGYFLADVVFDESDRPVDVLYVEANPVARRLVGFNFVGKRLRDLDPSYEAHWWETLGRVVQTGVSERRELYAEPLKAWFDVYVFKVGDGDSHRAAAVFQDVSDRKRAEQEREQLLHREKVAREAAEAASRLKDEFLAILSHELRSPLSPILGWTKLLQSGKLDPERQIEALKTIERSAKLQSQLVEDLLDTSRIMRGRLSLRAASVSLPFIISAAIESVRLAAEAKTIQIRFDADSAIAPVFGDAARLQQVLWNLLMNAVKFTPNGGKVTIELKQIKDCAQIRVIDTGKGIHAQFLPYAFEYFRQEDGSMTRQYGGLGLGLAIVRQIVELHGGTVKAESLGENQGAILTVKLPVMRQSTLHETE
ncbi:MULTISPECIES: PAS domain S-box protein [unclassified Leptolyngbya]|uniref:PAS domain S-box protein n=1 Tax=unclassified Leptolyngbya TaxID=2650499 RepID=UPI00168207D3|nr:MULTISPECIES: PAS domain S-box protein [unclassified Leptolyngbya]MBD1911335.1 PAS domain S-box protein [Leptolyngbya sp. FACHB-8]MBD2156647.1 PAS domain S-box protein [Leptolyngbya sp. FACHB-16]